MSAPVSIWRGNVGLVEQPTSGKLSISDKIATVAVFKGPIALCRATAPAKGTMGAGAYAGYKVESAEVAPSAGGIGELTVTWIPLSGDLPLDEVSCTPREQPKRMELHPRYKTLATLGLITTIKAAVEASTEAERSQAETTVLSWNNSLATELMGNLHNGDETYYWTGLIYEWSTHYWTLPSLTVGGFTEEPGGPMIGCFPGMSALRTGDRVSLSGYAWKVTRTWWIGPGDTWNAPIYSV